MTYCTNSDVKSYLKIPVADTSLDAIIAIFIPACETFIEEYCGRDFDVEARTQFFSGPTKTLKLDHFPVDLTEEIKIWDDSERKYEDEDLIDSDDYWVDGEKGIIYVDYEIGWLAGSIKVTYTGGIGAIPDPIKVACIELVAKKIKDGPQGNLGVSSRSGEGGNVSFSTDALLPITKLALDLYLA